MVMQEKTNVNIIITDACILIDLIELDLLDQFLQLMQNVYTTNQVVREITDPVQQQKIAATIASGQILTDDDADFSSLALLQTEYPALSIPDCSVLELAIRKQGIVFTSDGGLRKACVSRGLKVCGILWVIENLNRNGHISTSTAIVKLTEYSKINKRAPQNEIHTLTQQLQALLNSQRQDASNTY